MKKRVKVIGAAGVVAAVVLAGGVLLKQSGPAPTMPPYDRDAYMPNGRWEDVDHDCQDTRQEVLIDESLEPVKLDDSGCRVLYGIWWDPYTAHVFTDPGDLDIDHFVPLAEIHRSGGWAWDDAKKQAYANYLLDPDHLMAVSASANRSKGDRDPAEWRPPNEEFWADYDARWIGIKKDWGACFDAAERQALGEAGLKPCEPR